MRYDSLNDTQKIFLLKKEYEENKKSFADIAEDCGTYANKLRRDAKKFNIKIRDKSDAQKNALASGKSKHPTKGSKRSDNVKSKIGMSVLKSWENLSSTELNARKIKSKEAWENMDPDLKDQILKSANSAVRETSRFGSKLEHYLLNRLITDGYKVDFHKEQILSNTKLQIDLFLPNLGVAIEVDGPSHFEPVWGKDSLERNKKYDNKKTGLIIGKNLKLIRIKQTKDFSKSRACIIYDELKIILKNLQTISGVKIIGD
jgi:very-short-patch-repair endonuclease